MDDRVLYVAYGLLGTTVFLLVQAMWGFEREIQERGLEGEQAGAQRLSGLGRMLVVHVRWAGRVFSLVPPITAATQDPGFLLRTFHGFRARIDRSLVAAGKPYALSANDILGGIPVGFAFGFCVGFCLYLMTDRRFLLFPFPFLGVFYPMIWLRDQVLRRHNKIRRVLPFCMDLLTLSVEAGLDFAAALSRIITKLPAGPLADEVGLTLRELRMGKTRKEAFRDLANRIALDEVTNLCAALIQVEEIGASLGHILRVQAEELRQRRFRRAEKAAMEAPVKMLFPLIAFIFPTVFVVIFGPIIIRYFG
ncbi:MAG: type II secretion system F family protein [Planctomycetes bacterium]|nr:type II secretion system F family protein [Planctomycetota bacterium]